MEVQRPTCDNHAHCVREEGRGHQEVHHLQADLRQDGEERRAAVQQLPLAQPASFRAVPPRCPPLPPGEADVREV